MNESLISFLDNKESQVAIAYANLQAEPTRTKFLAELLVYFLQIDRYREAIKTLDLLPPDLGEEIMDAFITGIGPVENEYREKIQQSISLCQPDKRAMYYNLFLEQCIERGDYAGAISYTGRLGRSPNAEELKRIFLKCTENDNLKDAREIANILLGNS
jgi:hypothetical protein